MCDWSRRNLRLTKLRMHTSQSVHHRSPLFVLRAYRVCLKKGTEGRHGRECIPHRAAPRSHVPFYLRKQRSGNCKQNRAQIFCPPAYMTRGRVRETYIKWCVYVRAGGSQRAAAPLLQCRVFACYYDNGNVSRRADVANFIYASHVTRLYAFDRSRPSRFNARRFFDNARRCPLCAVKRPSLSVNLGNNVNLMSRARYDVFRLIPVSRKFSVSLKQI